ncbi:MAG: hypothetical protein JWO78_2324 [Micavibrio sp.]|nr:hypothetical protein [Micavibrio sp.]
MSRKKIDPANPGWSYPVDQGEVGPHPIHKKIKAGEADLKLVAKRLDIPLVDSLSAEIVLQRAPNNKAVVQVTGLLKADVVQSCVVTGAPVKNYIEEEFEGWYSDPTAYASITKARHEKAGKGTDVEVPILDEREDPEPMVNGKIDLGDLVCQYLSLGLDPYPRAHGVKAPELTEIQQEEISATRRNPFEALKDWKGKEKG